MYLLLAKALPLLTLCQAGGGGRFGGGGGGGGGFGGGGGGDGYLVYYLIRLAIEAPVIGVPVLIGAVIIMVRSAKGAKGLQERRLIRRARGVLQHHDRHVSWSAFEARDPGFDREAFLERVKVAFHKAQNGWCAQDLGELAPFVSDGVFERFSIQIEEQQQEGWQQSMDSIQLERLSFLDVVAGSPFDTITVRVPFRAQIARRSLETGDRVKGSLIEKGYFVECWTFVRRRGVKTQNGPGLMEGHCPNCGAPLSLNQSAKCGSCGCRARSGEFDWVLTEITQASAWRPESGTDVRGLEAFGRMDKGMSVQLLEDRASLAFWRKMAADRRGDIGPLLSVASARFCEQYGPGLQRPTRSYPTACAVGSVRALGLLQGEDRNHALVEICWDGLWSTAPGQLLSKGQRVMHRTLFLFERKAGAQTSIVDTLTTGHCSECGSHDEGGTGSTCPYCDTPRRGDNSTWLLDEVLTMHSSEARSWLDRLPEADPLPEQGAVEEPKPSVAPGARTTQSARDLLVWAAALVRVDHSTTSSERRALNELAGRAGLGEEEVEALLSDTGEPVPPVDPPSEEQAQHWLAELLQVAWADGYVSKAERTLLERVSKQLGMSHAQFKRALIAGRRARYRNSREALADGKS